MEILSLDFETYYSQEYSLDILSTEDYVVDSRFEEILLGVKHGDQPGYWLTPDRAKHFLRDEVDWGDTAVIAQHAHFEALILSHHHGVRPAMWIDTLSMARALDGPKLKNGLAFLMPRHGLGFKGHEIVKAKGKHYADFTSEEYRQYGAYCVNDCEGEYALAQIFLPQMPADELRVIDTLIRTFSEPVFIGDTSRLRAAVSSERQHKIELLQRIGLVCKACNGSGKDFQLGLIDPTSQLCKKCNGTGVDKKPIGSSNQFANLLRAQGVEPEMKISPTPNPDGSSKYIYAFAKTDPAMQALLEDEDEQVRILAETRVTIKSNIIETRAERFAESAERGVMPVYLSPFAAHTFRVGGGDKRNWQNISGHNEKRPELSVIKASVGAPPGFKCVRADSSQGEARIGAWNAEETALVEAFRRGDDVYSEHASTVFGRPVDRRRVKEDFIPGQIGKVSILGMQYGMGYLKAGAELLKGMLGAPPLQFTMADIETMHIDPNRFLNNQKKISAVNSMPSRLATNDRLIHFIVADALVQRYRQRMMKIVAYWKHLERIIDAMIRGEEIVFGANGCMRTGPEFILMPNGLKLLYKGVKRDQVTGQASYFDGRKQAAIHGAKIMENTTQCLHYILVSKQMLEIGEVLKVGLMTHDDIITVVPDGVAELSRQFMVKTMGKVSEWAAGLPLAGEGKIGQTLLDVK